MTISGPCAGGPSRAAERFGMPSSMARMCATSTWLNLSRTETAELSSATVPNAGLLAEVYFVSAPCFAHSSVLALLHAVLEALPRLGTAAATRRRNLRRSILDAEERAGTEDYCKPDYYSHFTSRETEFVRPKRMIGTPRRRNTATQRGGCRRSSGRSGIGDISLRGASSSSKATPPSVRTPE
jgi:hypothetical protein